MNTSRGGGVPGPGERPPDPSRWRPVELRGAYREVREEEKAALERRLESFARKAAAELGAYVGGVVEITLEKVRRLPFSSLRSELSSPTALYLAASELWREALLVQLDPAVLRAMLECVLGAGRSSGLEPSSGAPSPGPDAPAPRAGVTPLEEAAARPLVLRLLGAADGTVSSEALGCEIVDSESRPSCLEGSLPASPMYVAEFGIRCGPVAGSLRLVLPPDRLLLAALPRDSGEAPDGAAPADLLSGPLGRATVRAAARLTTHPLPLREVLAAQPGDVIDTGLPVGSHVAVLLDGEARYLGQLGTREGRLAVEVVRPVPLTRGS